MTTQLDLLTAVADNPSPLVDRYRTRIRAAIAADAAAHDGLVDSGRVRRALTGTHGLTVPPKMLAAQYGALAAQGVLVHHSWTTNDDHAGRNAGRPARVWLLVGAL